MNYVFQYIIKLRELIHYINKLELKKEDTLSSFYINKKIIME